MADQDIEQVKRIIRTLKILDWREEDIVRVVKLSRQELRKLVKDMDV